MTPSPNPKGGRPPRYTFPPDLDWGLPDADVAKIVGCQRWHANYMRRKLKKGPPREDRRRTTI